MTCSAASVLGVQAGPAGLLLGECQAPSVQHDLAHAGMAEWHSIMPKGAVARDSRELKSYQVELEVTNSL